MCNHENGVLVSSGVDEHGEWRSMECEDCGRTWIARVFHAWSQDVCVYEGTHSLSETIAALTIEDILGAMYTLNIELTDENLEEAIAEINAKLHTEFYYDLESFIDRLGLKRREQQCW